MILNKRKIVGLCFIVLALIWMGVIFYFSSQNGVTSSETSGKFTAIVYNIFYKNKQFASDEEYLNFYNKVSFFVRKGGHVTEYFILESLILIGLLLFTGKKLISAVLSVIIAVLYACSDEFHQSFIGGRGPSFKDVLIDSIGIFTALTIIMSICFIISIIKERRSN